MMLVGCGAGEEFDHNAHTVIVRRADPPVVTYDAGLPEYELCRIQCPVGARCSFIDGVCIVYR